MTSYQPQLKIYFTFLDHDRDSSMIAIATRTQRSSSVHNVIYWLTLRSTPCFGRKKRKFDFCVIFFFFNPIITFQTDIRRELSVFGRGIYIIININFRRVGRSRHPIVCWLILFAFRTPCKYKNPSSCAPCWPAPSITVWVASCPSSCAIRAIAWPWTNSVTATTIAATSPTSHRTVHVSGVFVHFFFFINLYSLKNLSTAALNPLFYLDNTTIKKKNK